MNESDEEAISESQFTIDMSRAAVQRVVLGSPEPEQEGELEWDDGGLDIGDSVSERDLGPGCKRPREESSAEEQDDGFTVVTGNKRRNVRSTPPADSSDLPQNNVFEVSVSSREVLPKQLGFAKTLSRANIQGVLKVTYKSPYKILVRFESDTDVNKFIESEIGKSNEWSLGRTDQVVFSYGIIRDIDSDIEEKDLKDIIESETEILHVKRLNRKNSDGKWVPSETVRVCFKGSVLPAYVKAYGCRMVVDSYTYPVTQCSNCWRYGHTKHFCPSKNPVCPKCGDKHVNCETTQFKCINCKGAHMSLIKSECPAFQRERNIRIIMGQNNCTYKVALRSIQEERINNKIKEQTQSVQATKSVTIEAPKINDVSSGPCTYRDILVRSKTTEMDVIKEVSKDPINKTKDITQTVVQSKKNKKKNNKRRQDESASIRIEDSQEESNETESEEEERKSERTSLLARLFRRIKEIIALRIDWGAKIELILIESVNILKDLFVKYCSVDSLLRFISNYHG